MRRHKFSVAALCVALLTLVGLSGCDWLGYHGSAGRTGNLGGNGNPQGLTTAWSQSLDGAVYASPIVHAGTIYVATEGGSVYAFAPNGALRWRTHLADPVRRSDLPCGNIDPLGITGTPVFDPSTGKLFAVAETKVNGSVQHQLFSLDGGNGAVIGHRLVSPPRGTSVAHQQRGALALDAGRVLVPFGGLAGDCGPYVGSIVATRTDLTGAQPSYAIPTARGAGMWTAPGPTVLSDGSILAADGNGESTSGYDGSDSVVRLDSNLKLIDRFSPSSWADDNAQDLDLGSVGPAVTSNGFVVQSGKRGITYVLRLNHLGGIGGQVSSVAGCAAYGGTAVAGSTVYLPCYDGLRRADVDANGMLRFTWQASGIPGSPVIYGHSLLAISQAQGQLFLLDPRTGATRAALSVGSVSRFATPALDFGRAYVGTLTGIVAVNVK
jgi:polyvinyl alcohol dehydrogenase (cytochrome)